MAKKIELAALTFDTSAAVANTANMRKELAELRDQMANLKSEEIAAQMKKMSGAADDNAEAIDLVNKAMIRNEVEQKKLQAQINANIRAIIANEKATEDGADATQRMTLALQMENSSIGAAQDQNTELRKIRKDVNTTTEEGKEIIKKLNAQIDINNKLIEENLDKFGKMKMNIGNYKEAMKDAIAEMNPFNGGILEFADRAKEAGGAGNLMIGGLKGMATGFLGAAKAAMAFILTPVGIVITAIVVAVKALQAAFSFMTTQMSKTEEGSDKLARAMSFFKGVMNAVSKILKPVAEFIFNNLVAAFEALVGVAEKAAGALSAVLRAVGANSFAATVDAVVTSVKQNADAALALAKAEEKLTAARRESKKTQLDYQKQAEKLRQLRDDESKSIPERIALNKQLGAVLDKQLKEELRLSQAALDVANLRIAAEGESTPNLDARAEALTEIADIQERITGQQSEQLANENSLRKEAQAAAEEARKKALANAVNLSKSQLALFESEVGFRQKTSAQIIADQEKRTAKLIEIAKKEFEASEKTESDKLNLKTKTNEANTDLVRVQTDVAISEAERLLRLEKEAAERRLSEQKYLSDETVNMRINEFDRLLSAEMQYLDERLRLGLINQQAYNDEMFKLNSDYQKKLKDEEVNRDQQQRDKKLIDLENERAANEENFLTQLEIEREQNRIRQEQEIAEAEKNGADINLIKAKYAKFERDIDRRTTDNKLALAQTGLDGLKGILGEHTAAAKAVAIYQATIDTYQGINKALASAPPPINYILAGAVGLQGFNNVRKITSENPKFEKGGIAVSGGNSHAHGGNKFFGTDGSRFEVEKGEALGVMNKNATSAFMAFNDAFLNTSVPFIDNGANISQAVTPTDNTAAVVNGITKALESMPPPVVTVEDINAGIDNRAIVENYANF